MLYQETNLMADTCNDQGAAWGFSPTVYPALTSSDLAPPDSSQLLTPSPAHRIGLPDILYQRD
jgi:hypothetical protein